TTRDALVAKADTTSASFKPAGPAGYDSVEGDAVWNVKAQSGYLRFKGLKANDPTKAQYQLWIVDPGRDAEPVDGGVFDIPEGQDEVVIPIDAKLAVTDPKAFVITLEQPGGVVVSEGPHLLIAAVN
nr:anti-sigma factor [Planctomycetota bacterium]